MKRGGPLHRKAPLSPGTKGLTRTGGLSRTPMTPSESKPAKRKPAARDTGPSAETRAVVHARSGGWCERASCKRQAVQIHHRRPRGAGGSKAADTNLASNLLDLCLEDHDWIEHNRTAAKALGLLLPSRSCPAEEPVETRHAPVPVLLDGTGAWKTVG